MEQGQAVFVEAIQMGGDNPSDRYLILSDGRCLGPFDASSVIACSIVRGMFTEEMHLCLVQTEKLRAAKQLAMAYLAYANRTALEVQRYLARKQVVKEIREQTVAWLQEQRMVNDAALGVYLVQRAKLHGGKDSGKALAAKMARRGIPPASAKRILEHEQYDELPAARVFAEKKWSELMRKQARNPVQALAASLSRKGFSRRTILAVLKELRANE